MKLDLNYHYKKSRPKLNCSIFGCENFDLQNHRIIPRTKYEDKNVLIVCIKHHWWLHKLIKEDLEVYFVEIARIKATLQFYLFVQIKLFEEKANEKTI